MAIALLALLLGLAFAFGIGGDSDSDPVEPIEGTEGDDEIYGGDRDDVIHGLGGDDTLHGGGGDDIVEGGEGDDLLYAGRGDDLLDGGQGNDTLESWHGRDTLLGDEGDDLLLVGSEDGTLADGGAGDDEIHWIAGEGTMRGGDGDDTIRFGGLGTRALADGLVEGGDGTDLMDLYGVVAADLSITFTDDGAGMLTDGSANVAFTGIEAIRLSEGDHLVDASASTTGVEIHATTDNRLFVGHETLIGGSGDDMLSEGNVMDGGAGDDLLIGSREGGVMTGGEGNDTFAYDYEVYPPDELGYSSGTVRVTDFTPGEDRVTLIVNYDEEYTLGGDPYTMDPPTVTIVEDPDANETQILVNGAPAMVLEGVTGVDPADIEIEVRPY